MADICTLVLITTQTLTFCAPSLACGPEQNGLIFCAPDYLKINDCNKPAPPAYECKRPDGSVYMLQAGEKR